MIAAVRRRGVALAQRVVRHVGRTRDLWSERQWERDRMAFQSAIPDSELTALLRRMVGCTFSEYCDDQRRRTSPRSFIPADREQLVATLQREFHADAVATIAAAETILTGTFDLLGSGPVDMRRGGVSAMRLDWNRDPTTGRAFPAGVSHFRAQVPGTFAAVGGDIKGPWEMGRCQHLPTLGQAYWLTGDERFARAYANTVTDFIARNPAGFGVQWACAMDVALRVVSWIVALDFFAGSPALTARWWAALLRSLVEHGRFIAANLEFGTIDGRIATSNHYLADVFGLYWLATTFPELDANVAWRGLSEQALEREALVQLQDDGTSFESSVPYHRLVTEMLLSAYALSLKYQRPFSPEFATRLAQALSFVRVIRQPAGRMPQVGDADNGRAHILTGYGRWSPESMDHLLAAGARVFDWPALAEGLSPGAEVERCFWEVAAPGLTTRPPIDANPKLYPNFGLGVARRRDTIVLLTNGRVGTHGFGNHKHCDQLALEVVIGTQPVFVDAGSFVYTSDPVARNQFRSTSTHNTVAVDDQEQHEFRADWLFRMFQTGTATLAVGETGEGLWLEGEHTAYARLQPPVTHHRRVQVHGRGAVTIDDTLDGAASHRCRWNFLLHPRVRLERDGHMITLGWDAGGARFSIPESLTPAIADAWYSPAYGLRTATKSIVCTATGVAGPIRFVLVPNA
jgi:hypothetical protein